MSVGMLLLVVSGCGEKAAGPAAVAPPPIISAAQLPAEITEKLSLYDVSEMVTLPRQNPFDSPYLAKAEPAPGAENGEPVQKVVIDPFQNIELGAIMLRKPRPMAVISFNNKSIIVREGEVLVNDTIPENPSIEISKIEKTAVHLYSPNDTPEMSVKTLELPSLIGYGKKAGPAEMPEGHGAPGPNGGSDALGGDPFFESDEYKNLPPSTQAALKEKFASEAPAGGDKKGSKDASGSGSKSSDTASSSSSGSGSSAASSSGGATPPPAADSQQSARYGGKRAANPANNIDYMNKLLNGDPQSDPNAPPQ